MKSTVNPIDRRRLFKLLGAGIASAYARPGTAEARSPIQKSIPRTGEMLTVIGMGTWQTFNVGSDTHLRNERTKVLDAFFEGGGQVIDSSPMYGSSQEVVGHALGKLGYPARLFAADKVWTSDGDTTREQVIESAENWDISTFDLMQVHNLLEWQAHLDTLEVMKDNGEVRYIGVTTSHGRRHEELERIMETRDLDFVQLTYNIVNREAEQRLLPLAREKGIAIIANRPFGGGRVVERFQRNSAPLPSWAGAIGCTNWPQFLLKFIVSHPGVTCAIPATTRVEHMRENMGAARGVLPDAAIREKMLNYISQI